MITLSRIVTLYIILLGNVCFESYAQIQNYRFEHLNEEQGLSSNHANDILQDSEGFMWFSTLDGLNKYDGYNFTVFRPDPNNPDQTLKSSAIIDIHEDEVGRIWITTWGGGLNYLDKQNNQVTHFVLDSLNENKWNKLNNIYESDNGSLWIAGTHGVAHLDPSTFEYTLFNSPENVKGFYPVLEDGSKRVWCGGTTGFYLLDQQTGIYSSVTLDSTSKKSPIINSLHLNSDSILWISTRNDGLFYLDTSLEMVKPQRFKSKEFPDTKDDLWFNDIIETKQGQLWVSSSIGLVRIDKQRGNVTIFQADPLDPFSLSHNYVLNVYEDNSENLWAGTINGVDKLTSTEFHIYQIIPHSASSFRAENSVGALAVDLDGKILFTTRDYFTYPSSHANFYCLNPKTREVTDFSIPPDRSDTTEINQIWSMHVDEKNRLWAGTETALYLQNSTTGEYMRYPSQIPVAKITEGPSGKLWFHGGGHGYNSSVYTMASFNPGNGEFNYFTYDIKYIVGPPFLQITDIMASHAGNIWLAFQGGLARFDQQTESFTTYLPDSTNPEGHINDTFIQTTYEDSREIIWIGSRDGGLNRYDPSTDKFTHFDMLDGLPTNNVLSITESKNGDLWLGTSKGLSRFNPRTEEFSNYNIRDGLPANDFHVAQIIKSEGQLIFGTDNGLVFFHPDSIQDKEVKPPVYITGVQVMEEERVVPTEPIELAYDQNFLSFDFVALNYQASEKNEYAYQMEGLDENWIYSGDRRFSSYTNLDPGEYTFRVKASYNKGPWNEAASTIQFTILPPWWQNNWAYAFYTLLSIGLLYALRQFTIKRERLRHALELQTIESKKMRELDHLKSRFFANISHEFRTPLTLILGPLEKFIQQNDSHPSAQSTYRMMQRNAQRLLNLVNQLLDLSKLESGNMTLDTQPQAIVPFLKSIALAFTSLAEQRQIIYHFQFPTENPVVYYDADKLEKIVSNLLSNAFKFTPDGGQVTVSIILREAIQKSGLQTLKISVQDSGSGIPENIIEHIFDRFYQNDAWLADEQQGSGIGLSLVHELVELHQGEITVENTENSGALFTVTLPVKVADYEEITSNAASRNFPVIIPEEEILAEENGKSHSAYNMSKPLVLVIEDNADVRAFIRETLQPNYRLLEAANGKIGLQQAEETIPDLIISDVMMPEMDGVTLCQQLKTDERTSHVPVILLTAKAIGSDKIVGLETGADDYMIKPFRSDELIARINNLIETRRKLRERYSQTVTLQPSDVAITSVDQQFLERMKTIVESHMADATFGVEAFSEEAGLSRVQLFRKLKALTDLSPSEFIKNMRLKRAADLLRLKGGTIGEIAFRVGFQDPSYFTKTFQKQYGQTPSDYMTETFKQ
ncbi:MAG: two-component regulator propeller domain-containing protein [Bacteroidota bacterium]